LKGARRARLILAGLVRSPVYQERLDRLVTELDLSGAVIFTGFIPDEKYRALLNGARLFVAPSRGEGFDLPALEAAASARAVICSDIPVHRELLGEASVFFPHGDAEALARCLEDLWERPEERDRLGHAARARAADFTWERMAAQLAALYLDIENASATPSMRGMVSRPGNSPASIESPQIQQAV
jgi:glycosyltransferase involved in cell wall biosynthesis